MMIDLGSTGGDGESEYSIGKVREEECLMDKNNAPWIGIMLYG